jgi:hypothetical protein
MSESPILGRWVLTITALFSGDWTKRLTDSANSTNAGPFLAPFPFEIYRQLAQEARRTHPPRDGQDRDQGRQRNVNLKVVERLICSYER